MDEGMTEYWPAEASIHPNPPPNLTPNPPEHSFWAGASINPPIPRHGRRSIVPSSVPPKARLPPVDGQVDKSSLKPTAATPSAHVARILRVFLQRAVRSKSLPAIPLPLVSLAQGPVCT